MHLAFSPRNVGRLASRRGTRWLARSSSSNSPDPFGPSLEQASSPELKPLTVTEQPEPTAPTAGSTTSNTGQEEHDNGSATNSATGPLPVMLPISLQLPFHIDNPGIEASLSPSPSYGSIQPPGSSQPELETPEPVPTLFRIGRIAPLSKDASKSYPLQKLQREPHNRVPVPTLAHGLDRVLFNPSIHWLQDPNSSVYNFNPILQRIPSVESFAFEKLGKYMPSSHDIEMHEMAKKYNKRFTGSTSSLTAFMSHIYFTISRLRRPDISVLSSSFSDKTQEFTSGTTCPSDVILYYKDGVYSVDSGTGIDDVDDKNIMSWQGTMLEKFLTLQPSSFFTLMRTSANQEAPIAPDIPTREAYQYSQTRSFVMRSQLDCVDPRLPGTGVFDIKTRAAVAIRNDRLNYLLSSGYLIRRQHGVFESFEREYYDLIRSAMIKYNFQARIGHMDGIFIAYHNTARIFGFQYLPLSEMDERLFGSSIGGDRAFAMCVELLEKLLRAATSCFPRKDIVCSFVGSSRKLRLFVRPAGAEPTEVVQLVVKVESRINGEAVEKAPVDFHLPENEWTLSYTIEKLEGKQHQKSNLNELQVVQKTRDRVKHYILPEGVGSDDIREYWTKINFSGKESPSPIEDEKWEKLKFSPPHELVLQTRKLAKEGREVLEREKSWDSDEAIQWRPLDD